MTTQRNVDESDGREGIDLRRAGADEPAVHTQTASEDDLAHVLILHEVDDYAAWKTVFDAAAGIRKDAGERRYHVLRDARTPRRIVHFSSWSSLEDARRFFESPRLVRIRQEAGVHAPEFVYLASIEQGVL